MPIRENAPDKRVHFLRLLRRRCTSRADCPNGFVGDDDTVEVRGCQPSKTATYFRSYNGFRASCLPLGEGFPHAHDHSETSRNTRHSLPLRGFIIFTIELTSF